MVIETLSCIQWNEIVQLYEEIDSYVPANVQ